MSEDVHHYLIIDGLLKRYTIVVEPMVGITSIYCDECDHWVAQYEGDHITTHTPEELLGKIVDSHQHDFGTTVEFSDETITFK